MFTTPVVLRESGTGDGPALFIEVVIKVYFRPLKKSVVLPLAIVKRGRATL